MSETHEREKARHSFRTFLQELDACPPTCTGPNAPDSRVEAFVEVDRSQATDCFLRRNPSYERFRDDLRKVRQGIGRFRFKMALWSGLCEE